MRNSKKLNFFVTIRGRDNSGRTYKALGQSGLSDGDYFHSTSIAVDGSDKSRVSFYDTKNRDLRCFMK